jgi:hypothetical protein
MSMPTFMVVGTQKAATTWLYECLHEHPEVFVPETKELHYFCPPDRCRVSQRHCGAEWYAQQFAGAGEARAVGELTTDYMFLPNVADELYKFNSKLNLVFLLRNPVDRAYSAYWMRRQRVPDMPSFETMLEQQRDYVSRGLYHEQIARFLHRFPNDQVRIYIYEELAHEPEAFLADLFGFLGVDADFRPLSASKRIAAATPHGRASAFLLYRLASPIINQPGVIHLWRALRRHTAVKEMLTGTGAKGNGTGSTAPPSGYPPMAPATRDRLLRLFRPENEQLFTLLGREIPSWRQ